VSILSGEDQNLQLAVFRSSNILANYNFPLIAALVVRTYLSNIFFTLSAQHKLLCLVQFFGLAMEVPFNLLFLFAQPSFRLAQ